MQDGKAAWRAKTRVWALALLGGVCVECGSADELDFDHVDPKQKSFEISAGIRDGYGRDRLASELAKCQLLCREHHKEKTLREGSHAGGRNKIIDPQHGTAVMYGADNRCRCERCKKWKVDYRAGRVDTLGQELAGVAHVG